MGDEVRDFPRDLQKLDTIEIDLGADYNVFISRTNRRAKEGLLWGSWKAAEALHRADVAWVTVWPHTAEVKVQHLYRIALLVRLGMLEGPWPPM